MIEIDLEQGTEAWHEFRSTKIGASMCPTIMGVNPYQKAKSLWKELLGFNKPRCQTSAMSRGLELEPLARAFFECKTGLHMEPVVAIHSAIDYMSASFDGMTKDRKNALEIKCNGEKNHSIALSGNVPISHMYQMQHQLFVCDLKEMFYLSFDGEDGIIIKVKRNDILIETILKEEERFFYCWQNFISPDLIAA
jgi:putative phage-type endonuclease